MSVGYTLDAIAQGIGVQVMREPLHDVAGVVEVNGREAVIRVNSEDARVRRRFTVAHELGRLFAPSGTSFRDVSFSGSRRETEANRFAASLLMPGWTVREADQAPMAEVAKKHGLSEQTLYVWRRRFGS